MIRSVHSYRNCCFSKVVHTTVTSSVDTPYYNFSIVRTLILNKIMYHRCHEKTSYVLNYAFFTLLHEWGDRGQMHRLEKLQ